MGISHTVPAMESPLALQLGVDDSKFAQLHSPALAQPAGDAAQRDGRARMERHPAWHTLSRLPVMLEASVPLAKFRVRDMVNLKPGRVLETAWPTTSDIPVRCGAAQLSWAEFEVVDGHLAVRLTLLG